jgi:hypothetical protein
LRLVQGTVFDQVVAVVVDAQGGLADFDGDNLAGVAQPDLDALVDDLHFGFKLGDPSACGDELGVIGARHARELAGVDQGSSAVRTVLRAAVPGDHQAAREVSQFVKPSVAVS